MSVGYPGCRNRNVTKGRQPPQHAVAEHHDELFASHRPYEPTPCGHGFVVDGGAHHDSACDDDVDEAETEVVPAILIDTIENGFVPVLRWSSPKSIAAKESVHSRGV